MMDELPKLLVDSYYSLDSDKIKLLGNKKYIEKIIPEMTEYNLTKYSKNKNLNIEVEDNGEIFNYNN